MAKLTETQEKYYYERQKKREERLKLQLQAQKKKELTGDGWEKAKKTDPTLDRDKVLQEISGIVKLPKVYDSIEIDSFFPPIDFFKRDDGSIVEIDYNSYENSQRKYYNYVNNYNSSDKETYDSLIEKELDPGIPLRGTPEKKSQMPSEFYLNIGKYLTRFAPIYTSYICTCCGMPKEIEEYYVGFNILNVNRIDYNGNLHLSVCKDCCSRIFDYIYKRIAQESPVYTMRYFCNLVGIYWDEDVFYKTRELMESNKKAGHIIEEYLKLNNAVNTGKTGFNSLTEIYKEEKKLKNQKGVGVNDDQPIVKMKVSQPKGKKSNSKISQEEEQEGKNWTPENFRDRKIIEKMVGYDPFYFEEEDKRPGLYRDLIGMLEQGMEQDQVKLQAAIQIVISYSRVRHMNEEINRLEKEGGAIADIKALSDLKNKELKNITDFSRDNGFSERFATAKAKGENTFTGIMNKMNEAKYEDGLLNAYDISTSETINQAAQASVKAIFEQLGLGETEVWKVAQDQLNELIKLRKENEYLQEELRKSKYEIARKNLIEKAQQRGIELDDEDGY